MNEVTKCPKCGSEMEEGYVKLSEGIRWRTIDHRAENFFGGELPFGPVIIQLISAVDVTIFCSVICEGVQHE